MKMLTYRASNTMNQASLRRLRLPGDGYIMSWGMVDSEFDCLVKGSCCLPPK